ncbi:sialic acid-binding Ig-like lectin 14 isoform X2 [Globicephala melas]|uniref:sialic acid-binding Ig-like lectin 14 isoform X2 n=1 Tax=Globicephala melas TaxID=9731 RepID=UPI00293D47BB|nr:sialic acid-binding Ig-like lectin 14 isoform X2 [Globicephala melas]
MVSRRGHTDTGALRAPRAGLGGDPLSSHPGRGPRGPRRTGRCGWPGAETALRGTLGAPHPGPGSVSLSSSALTQTPDIHVQGTLESGLPRNITCAVPWACERGTPHTFSWTGVALPSLHPKGPHSSVLTLTLGPQDHGTNLTCRVTFPGAGVSADRTIRLNVSYAPQNLDIRVFRGNRTEILGNATSLRVVEGQSLRLVCVVDSNPPTRISWARGCLTVSPSQPLGPGVLELPHVVLGDGGELTCQAQHPRGSLRVSLNLVVQGVSSSFSQVSGERREGSWPLVLTLLRGALMGAGFLLTYGLTWIYYTRCRNSQGNRLERCD